MNAKLAFFKELIGKRGAQELIANSHGRYSMSA